MDSTKFLIIKTEVKIEQTNRAITSLDYMARRLGNCKYSMALRDKWVREVNTLQAILTEAEEQIDAKARRTHTVHTPDSKA
jgi:hypothetical protein